MHSLERERRHESFNQSLSRIAYAYGFSSPAVQVPKKALSASGAISQKTAASLALLRSQASTRTPTQAWGSARSGKGTLLSFAIFSTRQAIAHALVVKTVLSIAELAAIENVVVQVSSTGDAESKRRFTRELSNYFKKNIENILPDIRSIATHDPDRAYHAMVEKNDPMLEKAPRPIDFLSENSRKVMLETLSLFEAVGIPYVLEPRILGTPGVTSELLFTVIGTDRKGEKVRIAEGGRFDDVMKKEKQSNEPAISMSMYLDRDVDPETPRNDPACFVVHVGDIAKLRAFTTLEALWRSELIIGHALMSLSLREQILKAQELKTRYIAIIGQREALDNTAIVRNLLTQMQVTLPLDKLSGYIARTRTH